MNIDDFDVCTKRLFDQCYTLICEKRTEYALSNPDRLCQFKQIAAFTGETPEKVLLGMLLKHWQSIMTFIQTPEHVWISKDKWLEKIGDNIVYSALLWALVVERIDSEEK